MKPIFTCFGAFLAFLIEESVASFCQDTYPPDFSVEDAKSAIADTYGLPDFDSVLQLFYDYG